MRAFNLRGTNGSGKTFTARAILEKSRAVPVEWTTMKRGGQKPRLYKGELFYMPIYILGSYEQHCGGCDTIPSVQIVAEMLHKLLFSKTTGLVLYEGLMISHMIGTVGHVAHMFNSQHVMGFLDTPLEICIERVNKRRVDRGNDKPFDAHRTLVPDYRRVQMARANAERLKYQVVTVPWRTALDSTLNELAKLGELEWQTTSPKKSHTG